MYNGSGFYPYTWWAQQPSLRPVKNRGIIYFVGILLFEFIALILYFVLQCFIYSIVSFVSCAVHIYCYSGGGNSNSHSAF